MLTGKSEKVVCYQILRLVKYIYDKNVRNVSADELGAKLLLLL